MTTTNPRPGRAPSLADRLWSNALRGRSRFSAVRPNARRAEHGLAARIDLLEPRALLTAATAAAAGEHVVAAGFLPDVADLLVSDDFAGDFAAFDGSAYDDHAFADAETGEGHSGPREGGVRSFSVTFDLAYDRDVDLTDGQSGGGWSFSEVLTLTYEIIEVWADDGGGAFTTTHSGGLSYQYHGAGFAGADGQSRTWSLTSGGGGDAVTVGAVSFDPAEDFDANGAGVFTSGTGSVTVNESFVDSGWWSNESGSLDYDAGGVTWASNWNAGSDFVSVHDTTAVWSYDTVYADDRGFNASETDVSGDGRADERFAATATVRSSGSLTSRTDGFGDAARVVSNGGSYSDTVVGGTTYAAASHSLHVEDEQLYERESESDPVTPKAGGDFLRLATAAATPSATTSYSSATTADFTAAGLGGTVDSVFAAAWGDDADPPDGWEFDEDPGVGAARAGATYTAGGASVRGRRRVADGRL